MNIKTFTIIAIASFVVLSVTACGGKQKASIETEQTEETSKTEVIVSDNKLFINSDLYNMSEEKVIFNAHGRLDPDNPSFGTDHIDHYRTLFVKENGGLTVGYVVKTTRGITLQTGKTFYFYNDLCLKERTRDLYNIVGMVKNNGVLIPMKITIDGEDKRIMLECKGDETLTFVPLHGDDSEIEYTVQALKDYCHKNKLTIHAVPYLEFTD
jgi:hypothetical protein